ncbi:formate dehydrogenase [Malassezia psittaci]|uniref:Formate dehydrogenase n=1 Tax=Malassezia psittaci TaxID=1821823 RepID=A0AAF0FE01_9BASI|nr:formate dehydrogenase [Malassezia psittaci]
MFSAIRPAASTLSRATRTRTFMSSAAAQDKVVAVLYPGGKYAKRQPKMLGSVENELGLREWIESQGHELVVTADKDGPNSTFQREAKDASIIITTPFHPAYVTKEIIDNAPNLKACVTAGVGSDHVDLEAANARKIGVYEVTGSNVTSVAEHAVMTILVLVRNFVPAHNQYAKGEWNVAEITQNSYDVEGKVVGTLGIGRIGRLILQRLKPFDCKQLLYYDYNQLDTATEKQIGCERVEDLEDFVSRCDVITINAPLHAGTQGLFNKKLIDKMKPGAWIVNTARGAICVKEDIAKALEDGQLNGYGGDVSYPQPAAPDHPWHKMHNTWNPELGGGNAMTPHISGTSLDAQARYVAGTKDILERIWGKKTQVEANIIVENGKYVSRSYGQH